MPLYLNWLTIAVALMIIELIIPGTYLIWFGFAAMVVGIMTWLIPDLALIWQLIWLALLSVFFAVIGWRIYGKLIFKQESNSKYKDLNNPIAQMKGKTVEIASVKGDKIQVSIGDTVWPELSEDKLKVGDKAVIIGSPNGVELTIQKK